MGKAWRTPLAATLDCVVVAIQIGLLFGVTPYLWWTAYRDGLLPNSANHYRFIGLWNHDSLRETIVFFISDAAAWAAALSMLSLALDSSRVRGRVLLPISLASLIVYFLVHVSLID
jgi:hypothetical protein